MKKIWIIIWSTESSDRGTLGYFTKKPTEKQLEKLKEKYFPEEKCGSACPAAGTGWSVYFEVEDMIEEKLPK